MTQPSPLPPKAFTPQEPPPSSILDLQPWKISLPTGKAPAQVTRLTTGFTAPDLFTVVSAVQFTAPVGGSVQAGAKYPRSELREMNRDGSQASWSTSSGTHTMEITERITHLPAVKPELVAGQIHDADVYVVLIWLSKNKLSVMYSGVMGSVGVLDDDYTLGKVFTVKIVASGGFIDVYYNGELKVHQADPNRSGCYFKAGCYTQSNPSKGDASDDYGQVEILALDVNHTA